MKIRQISLKNCSKITSACLLFGATTRDKKTTAIYLVVQIITMVFMVTRIIILVVTTDQLSSICESSTTGSAFNEKICGRSDASIPLAITFIFFFVVGLALSAYFWFCVFSFWKALESTRPSSTRNLEVWSITNTKGIGNRTPI